jgi:hypothetical protein
MADVIAQMRFWGRHPPPGTLIEVLARYIGWEPPEAPRKPVSFEAALAAHGDLYAHPERFFKHDAR